jgi:uncharacterized protein YecT (DUF1311 family)
MKDNYRKWLGLTCFVIILGTSFVIGQELPSALDERITSELRDLEAQLETKDSGYDSEAKTNLYKEFVLDTFKIERRLALRIDEDYSTASMVKASYEAEQAYDALLNKYYKVLIERLNSDDKEVLKHAQRSWLSYRDAERKFYHTVAKEEYSGGGTIQRTITASRFLHQTKSRVIELYRYINDLFNI